MVNKKTSILYPHCDNGSMSTYHNRFRSSGYRTCNWVYLDIYRYQERYHLKNIDVYRKTIFPPMNPKVNFKEI